MKQELDVESLVGKEIGVLDTVFDTNGKEIKKIKIIKATETKNGLIVFDEEGTPYHETELNWPYKLTPEFLLYSTLLENGIDIPSWNCDEMHKIFNEFMNKMISSGYVNRIEK